MRTVDELIDYVARTESGGSYTAWNPDDNGAGVSAGLIQFNQRRGALPDLFARMYRTDERLFRRLAPDHWVTFIAPDHVRTMDLNLPGPKADALALLREPLFQQVQRDLTRQLYFEPAWRLAKMNGLCSERAAAFVLDVAVHRDLGWLEAELPASREFLTEKSAIASLADLADSGLGGEEGRRHKILRDSSLSDDWWSFDAEAPRLTLRRGDKGSAVKTLQDRLIAVGVLQLNGRRGVLNARESVFGPDTDRAVRAVQAIAGLTVDGICGPRTWAVIDAAVAKIGTGAPHR